MWLAGQPVRAWILAAIAAAALLPVLVGVPLDRHLMAFGLKVAHVVSVLATGVVGMLLILIGGLGRLVGLNPLTSRRGATNRWHPSSTVSQDARFATATFSIENARADAEAGGAGTLRRLGRRALFSIGAVGLLVSADLGIGLAWESFKHDNATSNQIIDAVNFSGERSTTHDPRADLPAMRAYPWADSYFREIQLTPSGYWPFTESRPRPFRGKYVHISGWSRRSYVPKYLRADAPVIWMFGGSTTWGEGQRDDYTIASDLARIAERNRQPIRIVNYGQRGWTHFQEMILFEQLLASERKPDLALFYDGANEINAQSLGAKGVPTHTLVDQYAAILSDGKLGDQVVATPSPWRSLGVIWDEYATHSAIRKLIGRIRDVIDAPAGADETTDDQGKRPGPTTNYNKTFDDAKDAVAVYERGRRMTEHLAIDHGVDAIFFWQPVKAGPVDQWAADHISGPTINISDALDAHQDVYIDGGHTNEVGAQVVAERIWTEIKSKLPPDRSR